jgi:2-iminobutanoate/2-iminopropanoate deaminase
MERADRLGLMKKEAVNTGPAPLSLPFSPAVKLGELLFVSGQGPIDKTGKVIPGDIRAQTKATLENFKRIMEAAGSNMDCVLQTTVYLKDLAEFAAMNETYSGFFNDPKPARTTVQAGDLLFGMKVEVQGIAYVPDRQKK